MSASKSVESNLPASPSGKRPPPLPRRGGASSERASVDGQAGGFVAAVDAPVAAGDPDLPGDLPYAEPADAVDVAAPADSRTTGGSADSGAGCQADPMDEAEGASGAAARRRWFRGLRGATRNFASFLTSMTLHLCLVLALALWQVGATPLASVLIEAPPPEELEELVDEVVEIKFEESIVPAEQFSTAVSSSAPQVGVSTGYSDASLPTVTLDQRIEAAATSDAVAVAEPQLFEFTTPKIMEAMPEGTLGVARTIVDDYAQAMDLLTQELQWLLQRGDVLVVWCFDQSESMKDDQAEIRDRVDRVYQELKLTTARGGEKLLTSISSYGAGFQMQTREPTNDYQALRSAIAAIPVDPSGKEIMCSAVGRAIALHRDFARKQNRQLVLILVTDESGEPENNDEFLEQAVAEAKAAKCRVYVLGREAVFGYPKAHMRWQHPQTKHIHWLPIDRGPETAFVEQLQTDGFHRRYDAFPSGFGPYPQTRLARETGGVFYMLPSLETNLVRGSLGKYELEALRVYRPDLSSRFEMFARRDKEPLRTFLWGVINDLNPYNPATKEIVELRIHFSTDLPTFTRQARVEQAQAILYINYLDRAAKILEKEKFYRDQEPEPRWQANYDLIHAQLVAYRARAYEYGTALEEFIRKPKVAEPPKSPNTRFAGWEITTRAKTVTEESKPYIEQSTKMFQAIIQEHAGSPWAARAEWELKRGFGVDLVPDYDTTYVPPPGEKVIPIPKL